MSRASGHEREAARLLTIVWSFRAVRRALIECVGGPRIVDRIDAWEMQIAKLRARKPSRKGARR